MTLYIIFQYVDEKKPDGYKIEKIFLDSSAAFDYYRNNECNILITKAEDRDI